MGLFIKQMLEIPTTNPRLPNSCGQTPAALAIHAWLDSQVKTNTVEQKIMYLELYNCAKFNGVERIYE